MMPEYPGGPTSDDLFMEILLPGQKMLVHGVQAVQGKLGLRVRKNALHYALAVGIETVMRDLNEEKMLSFEWMESERGNEA